MSGGLRRRAGLRRFAALLVLTAAGAAPASALDIVCLKDGRVIDGLPMKREAGAILVSFKHGDVRIPDALIHDSLLDAEIASAGSAKSAAMKKRLEERRKYAEELKSLAEWRNRRKESTRHFDFEYTVPPHVFARYRDTMEAYFTEFAKMWSTVQPKDGRLLVCFYGDQETFNQVSGAPRGVLGYFRFVQPRELDIYYDRLDDGLTQHVMFHEANHYLQSLLNPKANMPHFPGEALAEYYGASQWDEKTKNLKVGLVLDERLAEVKSDVDSGKMQSLEELLATDRMYEHYTWGWSLIHFLMNQDKYQKKFQRFVTTLANGSDVKREPFGLNGLMDVKEGEVKRVFMKCLDLKNKEALLALEREWHGYVQQGLKAATARGLEKAGLNVAASYPPRPIKAKNLLEKAIDAGSTNPLAYDKLASLYAGEDEGFEKAIPLWRKAIELDPLTARFYSNLGHALTKKGQKDEGKRLIELAKELDPDDPWLDLLDLRDE
jgi:tetratricopeptide (TPR) repeat protein